MMVFGTAVSALGAYAFQVIGGRALGADAFAPVSVMWTVLFLGLTVFLLPLEQLVIRRVVLSRGRTRPLSGAVPTIVAVIAVATAAAIAFVLVAGDRLLGGDAGFLPVAGVMFLSHGALALGRGYLAGTQRFFEYGLLVALDAVGKVIGAVIVAVAGWGPVALSWALVVSPVVVVGFRYRGTVHAGVEASMVDPARRFMGGFLVATAASQTVLASGPLVVGALGASAAAVSVFFVTTTLFRGPMSASYNILARVLPAAIRHAEAGDHTTLDRWARRILAAGLTAAVVVGLVGAALGPWTVTLLYGAEFRPDAWLSGFAAAGVAAGMAGLATTQILVGRGATGRLAVVWLTAIASAAATIGIAGAAEPTTRVALAFCVGEVVALVGLSAAALVRRSTA